MINLSKVILGGFLLLAPFFVSAHPGNTAADGCHYCRTNCDKWGVAWNERHCHNLKPVSTPALQPVPVKVESVTIPIYQSVLPEVPEPVESVPAVTAIEEDVPILVASDAKEEKRGLIKIILGMLFGWLQ